MTEQMAHYAAQAASNLPSDHLAFESDTFVVIALANGGFEYGINVERLEEMYPGCKVVATYKQGEKL